jgi:hypothetical protein
MIGDITMKKLLLVLVAFIGLGSISSAQHYHSRDTLDKLIVELGGMTERRGGYIDRKIHCWNHYPHKVRVLTAWRSHWSEKWVVGPWDFVPPGYSSFSWGSRYLEYKTKREIVIIAIRKYLNDDQTEPYYIIRERKEILDI